MGVFLKKHSNAKAPRHKERPRTVRAGKLPVAMLRSRADPSRRVLHCMAGSHAMTRELTRRQFLSSGAAASATLLPIQGLAGGDTMPAENPPRKFYAILSVG